MSGNKRPRTIKEALKGTATSLMSKLPRAVFIWIFISWGLGYLGALDWRFELASHFKLQYLFGALAFGFLFAVLKQWRWLGAATCCALISGLSVIPWYFPRASANIEKSPRRLRLLLSNVYFDNQRYDKFLNLVRAEKPDLIFAQEVTAPWAQALETIREDYPYGAIKAAEEPGGLAALSRLPLTAINESRARESDWFSYELELEIGGAPLHIITAHPEPPIPKLNMESRNRRLEFLAERARSLSGPRIVIGDLNVTMWSPHYQDFIAQADLVSAREGFGVIPTWPTFLPLMRIPIDHCLVSKDIWVSNIRTGPDIGSDHFPLIVDLDIPAKL
jgi:endonuclease/exonuclease/phosphatase (EEP) superfamily protein YafD